MNSEKKVMLPAVGGPFHGQVIATTEPEIVDCPVIEMDDDNMGRLRRGFYYQDGDKFVYGGLVHETDQ